MNKTWLAYEEDEIIGSFLCEVMANKWVHDKPDVREVYSLPVMDKTFSQMVVETNRSYEG